MMPHPSFLEAIKGYGGYSTSLILIIGGLLTWWRVLPAVIEAISNRQSKVEERMGKLLDDATARFSRELMAADKRHDECMEASDRMRSEIDSLRGRVAEQDTTIEGLRRQLAQMQVSFIRTDGLTPSPMIEAAAARLDDVRGSGE